MSNLPLRQEEIEASRRPQELLDWCSAKIEDVAGCEGGIHAVRFGIGLCKPLTEEVYPLAIWATYCEDVDDGAVLIPKIGSQPYDAEVQDPSHEPPSYFVEITQAHMGQSEHFRMIHLERRGWAPGPLSEMTRVGGRGSLDVHPGRVLGSVDGYIHKTTELVTEAIIRKLNKDYKRPIILVVAFEDFILKNYESTLAALSEPMIGLLSATENPFEAVYLVGMSSYLVLRVNG